MAMGESANINKNQRDPVVVSKIMSSIRSNDTSIEVTVRKALWKKGFRYRKNYRGLFGKPDIVFMKQRVVVFCDSDFWHGRDWGRLKKRMKTNPGYWIPKIERNIGRDREVDRVLKGSGWTVLRCWESDIKANASGCLSKIISHLV